MTPVVVRVWGGRLNECPAADSTRPGLDRALALLSDDERVRADRMGSAGARARFVLARATLRLLLAGVAGDATGPRDLRFRYGRHGKPYLPGGLSFNVSHSADALVVAVTEQGRVGVDVERVRPVRRMDRVAARRFAPTEQAWMAATVDGPPNDHAFFRIWTRKEAFAKALGGGLAAPYRSFSVAPLPGVGREPGVPDDGPSNRGFASPGRFDAQGGLASVDIPGETAAGWTVASLPCVGDSLAALAVDEPSAVVAVQSLAKAVPGADGFRFRSVASEDH